MKKIATIAAIAALTTLTACDEAAAPAEVTATEAANTEAVTEEAGVATSVETAIDANDGAVSPREVSEENPAVRPQ